MQFFVPDWDDRVDPGYEFRTDRFSLSRDPYADDVYAHELFDEPVYDGILVSRSALSSAGPKRELVEKIGMRGYLRMPPELELFGDCGAYGYIREKDPIYDSVDVVKYYEQYGFNYGVSVDHLIVTEVEEERSYRYELTLRNAERFLQLWRQGNHHFTPVGAIQGWDARSYAEAATAVSDMGYEYVAIGGLARSRSLSIEKIVRATVEALPQTMRVHVFGVARPVLLPLFLELGVSSVDSAAPLRQAWLSARSNYYTADRAYAAIRIPVTKAERAKGHTLVGRSQASYADLAEAESEALSAIRAYDKGMMRLEPTLRSIVRNDRLLASRIDDRNPDLRYSMYRETLKDKPWQRCPCPICAELGVEVIIFRGNNRNRRRGFHNLWVQRRRIEALQPSLHA